MGLSSNHSSLRDDASSASVCIEAHGSIAPLDVCCELERANLRSYILDLVTKAARVAFVGEKAGKRVVESDETKTGENCPDQRYSGRCLSDLCELST
jgi:hypothetical protein